VTDRAVQPETPTTEACAWWGVCPQPRGHNGPHTAASEERMACPCVSHVGDYCDGWSVARAASQDALLREWVEHHQPEGYEGIQDCSDINDRTEAYLARAASQERPQPLPPCPICGKDDLFIGTDGKPGCPHCEVAVTLSGVAQERPPIDVERLAQAMNNVRPYGGNPSVWAKIAAQQVADEYARLAGGSVASPEPSDG
jgi:hypothetical protein